MKTLKIALLVGALLILGSLPAKAEIVDAPQHVVGAGGGCDGNHQCSGDAFFAEKLTGATYSVSYVEFVPSFITTTAAAPLGSSANLTTNITTTSRVLSIKPIVSTGAEQVVWQSGRNSAAVGGVGGFALPSGAQPSVNFATGEHASWILRLNKTLNTGPGTSNWYAAFSVYLTQIMGIPNGQTWAFRLNLMHGSNGSN